jgi:ATP-binding cassette subfamily D (ALD) long-chain fatty acid import protein
MPSGASANSIAPPEPPQAGRKMGVRSFKELQRWMEGIYSLKIRYNMLEDMILKYSWSRNLFGIG